MVTYSFIESEPIVLKALAFAALIAIKDNGTRLRVSRWPDRMEMRMWTPEGDYEFLPWSMEAATALAVVLTSPDGNSLGDMQLLLRLEPLCLRLNYSMEADDGVTIIDISLPTVGEARESAHAIFSTMRRRSPASVRGASESDFIRNMIYMITLEMEKTFSLV
jgi:hypothetical protein